MQYLEELRGLAGRNNLSKFSDFWAPDHKNTMPMKPAFAPEKLVAVNEPLLAQFYDGGRISTKGEADSINPPYFRISRELMGRVLHTFRREYISDDEHGRLSEDFKEHVKDVLAPLETTLADSAKRLEEQHVASMEQHEKLVKDTHDFLAEASEQFKTALTKQVRVMERHNARHEILKESTAALANSARMRFRDISIGALREHAPKDMDLKPRKVWAESMLAIADEEHKKALEGWIEERKVFQEKIKCMEEEHEKLKAERYKFMDQVSAHAIRNHRKSQEQIEEKAKAAKLAEDYAELRRIAEHNEDVGDRAKKLLAEGIEKDDRQRKEDKEALQRGDRLLQSLRDMLKGARQERDAAVLENQDLKRKREVSTSPPPSPVKILSRPQGAAAV